MKNTVWFLMVLIITTQSVFAQTNKKINPLIGRWETPNRADQKTITTMNITAYGKIEYNVSVPLSGSFIAFGNTLVSMIKNPQTGSTEVDTSTIVLKGDTLFQKSHTGGKESIIRSVRIHEGKEGPGIIGSWLSDNFNGYRARQQFTTYNSILVDLIIKTFNGNYDIKGDEIIINFFNSRPLRIKYSITNDVLSIQNEGTNKQLKLNRIVK